MKSLAILLALTVSASAFAQQAKEERVTLDDGSTIVRINVGNEKNTDDRETAKRIARLERAVRELQNKVYDLEDEVREQSAKSTNKRVSKYTCTTLSLMGDTIYGEASEDELAAKIDTQRACYNTSGASLMLCDLRRITCNKSK